MDVSRPIVADQLSLTSCEQTEMKSLLQAEIASYLAAWS
jgi:hypothetical protein